MADIPTPSGPSPTARAGRAFKGRSVMFYAAFAAGVGLLAWQIRKRENSQIPAPNADAVPTGVPDPVAVGSFQGYDSAAALPTTESQLGASDALSFILDWTAQRNDFLLQSADIDRQRAADAAAAAQAAAEAAAGAQPTGGGLPDQPIPNTAPPAAAAPAQSPCPAAFPRWNPGKGSPSKKSCFKECKHTECSNTHKQYVNNGHCYQDGTRVHAGNDYTGKRC